MAWSCSAWRQNEKPILSIFGRRIPRKTFGVGRNMWWLDTSTAHSRTWRVSSWEEICNKVGLEKHIGDQARQIVLESEKVEITISGTLKLFFNTNTILKGSKIKRKTQKLSIRLFGPIKTITTALIHIIFIMLMRHWVRRGLLLHQTSSESDFSYVLKFH